MNLLKGFANQLKAFCRWGENKLIVSTSLTSLVWAWRGTPALPDQRWRSPWQHRRWCERWCWCPCRGWTRARARSGDRGSGSPLLLFFVGGCCLLFSVQIWKELVYALFVFGKSDRCALYLTEDLSKTKLKTKALQPLLQRRIWFAVQISCKKWLSHN